AVFEILIHGSGAHAAMPHLGIAPIVVASQVVLALHTVVSRNIDPIESAVLSVTQLHAGETWNASPETAVLRGTVRAFNDDVRCLIERRIRELAEHVASAYGG